jgi:L-ascorbate metabolism protein UlaG (beta-lactamase superfamily)
MTPAPDELRVTYVGHATLLIEIAGVRILTDPLLRGSLGHLRRLWPTPAVEDLGPIDAVLISHLHHDHADVPSLGKLPADTRVLVPEGSGAFFRSAGFENATELPQHGVTQAGPVELRAVAAAHSGKRMPLGPTADAIGYLIRAGEHSVYFAGDTALFDGMVELRDEADVALLPVWGWGPNLRGGHLDPETAAEAVAVIRPRVSIPIHWGTFWPRAMGRIRRHRLTDPPREFQRFVEESGSSTRVSILAPGARWQSGMPHE